MQDVSIQLENHPGSLAEMGRWPYKEVSNMSEDEQAIRTVVATWIEATRRGDIQAVLDLMTEDALFLVPGQPPMDKAAFATASRSQASAKLDIDAQSEIREVRVEGTMGYIWSHLRVTVTPAVAGEKVQRAGHTLTVFRKTGGRWLLSRDANLLVRV
jgi:uncharacterized protein (TIGR02246 family)